MNNPHGNRSRHPLILAALALCAALAVTPGTRADDGTSAARANDAVVTGDSAPPPLPAPTEKFISGAGDESNGATIELRDEASIQGGQVTLKQICRWSDHDAAAFASVADLVVLRIDDKTPFVTIGIDKLHQTLHDAGVNFAVVRLIGPSSCTVNRIDVPYNEQVALQQWVDEQRGIKPAPAAAPASTTITEVVIPAAPAATLPPSTPHAPPADPAAATATPESGPDSDATTQTLKQALIADLAIRVKIPADQLQVSFNPQDIHLLNLAGPQFRFNVDGRNIYDLGNVSWDVLIVTDAGGSHQVQISALARAWQTQTVVAQPLAYHQVIRPGDITERRTLIDRVPEEVLLTAAQAVGQQSVGDLKPGAILAARMIESVPMVKPGQLVTVTLRDGSISVRTVATAIDDGCYGQTIRVKNDSTDVPYQVVVTGPQQASMGPTPPSK